ncbi:ADP-ribosylglycohydrolase family protein [Aquimarina sp. RZ0]|uniref:ADP-ribosylglycohydrolase family protein n=1 Tax=Aquimarina sp. RZ0 TaxID=2607730 RepID=UPI0011F28BC3|nr:hypothetical protein F0000_20855 [Aquimarina sp. RZ0]
MPEWNIIDDNQLIIATCEALLKDPDLDPKVLSDYFVSYFAKGTIRGIGASTLKAFRELQLGVDWSQSGRRGEYAAGNGAAMRIAPIAFFENIPRERIEEICSITHKNVEAYIGALAVLVSIRIIKSKIWKDSHDLLQLVANELPDSRVRDRVMELSVADSQISIQQVAVMYGNDGYVVNSVPFCIFSASKIKTIPIGHIFDEIIESGRDTDTNCSITGQICGAHLGITKVPVLFLEKLQKLPEYEWFSGIVELLAHKI